MIISDLLDVLIVHQILKQGAKVCGDFDLGCGDNVSSRFVDAWVDVKLKSSFKHSAQRLEDSALQVRVIFFLQNFEQTGHTHDKADRSVCVTKEISGESIIFAEFRD